MSAPALVAFNLVVNALGSFALGSIAAWAALRALRPGPGRARQALLLLPLGKVLFDAARGVPEGSFLWQTAAGAHRDVGAFQVGLGVKAPLLPVVHVALGALSSGQRFSSSAADIAADSLAFRGLGWAPGALAAVVLSISAMRLLAAGLRWLATRRELRRLETGSALLGFRRAGRQRVRVVVSASYRGVPFAAGLLRPFVCLPASLLAALSPDELEAVIAHEIAHVAHRDLWLDLALIACRAALWFVPGLGATVRRVRAECELVADDAAVRAGVSPLLLSSAIVRVGELLSAGPRAAPGIAIVGPRSSLGERVGRLLSPAGRATVSPSRRLAHGLFVAWVAASLALSTLAGNH